MQRECDGANNGKARDGANNGNAQRFESITIMRERENYNFLPKIWGKILFNA
jgi:hypothetical protein